jgi:universal stress protein F
MTTKTIIVGADGSKNMPRVLDAAAAVSQRLGAAIVLVTAMTDDIDAESIQHTADEYLGRVNQCVVVRQQAWRAICDEARNRDGAAVVVVGAHGYSGRGTLGTTAAHVVAHSEVPVLVVRGAASFERILVAHDGSKRAPAVLLSALQFLAPAQGRLVLVRAIEPLFRSPFGPPIDAREIEKLVAEDVAASVPHARTQIHARLGAAWKVVLEAARTSDAGLIVIGSHGYQLIDDVLGTTAARIVNQADRCVLVVKGEALQASSLRLERRPERVSAPLLVDRFK